MHIYKLTATIGKEWSTEAPFELRIVKIEVVDHPKTYIAKGGSRYRKEEVEKEIVKGSSYDRSISGQIYAVEENLEDRKTLLLADVKRRLQEKLEAVNKLIEASKTEVVILERWC